MDVLEWLDETAAGNVVLVWTLLVVVNIPAPWLGIRFDDEPALLWYQPPGWVIGVAWFVLFALLGVARAHLVDVGTPDARVAARLIVWLAAWCALYAYYTIGLARLTGMPPLVLGLAGNLLTIAVSLYVAWRAAAALPAATWLVVPVAVWTSYATLLVIGLMRRTQADVSS